MNDDPQIEALAQGERATREMHFAWQEKIKNYLSANSYVRVPTSKFLTECLGLASEKITVDHQKQLKIAMNNLEWDGPKDINFSGKTLKGYERIALD